MTFSSAGMSVSTAARSPVHECLVPETLFDLGLGNVVFSRHLPSGEIGMAVFLLDVFCLGVKNAIYATMAPEEYASRKEAIVARESFRPIHPSCARKLVEGAVQYAGQLGLGPHRDYDRAKRIFGEIDPATCPQEFAYGHEGKPLYVSGPNDTPARFRHILATLERTCGRDGFHYLIGLGPSSP